MLLIVLIFSSYYLDYLLMLLIVLIFSSYYLDYLGYLLYLEYIDC
jgi:hypothetical protein